MPVIFCEYIYNKYICFKGSKIQGQLDRLFGKNVKMGSHTSHHLQQI